MKFLNKLNNIKAFIGDSPSFATSCSVVGSSGTLLERELGNKIDSNENIMRFNNAITKTYEKNVGSKTTHRILNCHFIYNIESEGYFRQKKHFFPNLERFFAYNLRGENIIFKTNPHMKLWQKRNILKEIEKNNNVSFISDELYNFGLKINNNVEPTNGFMGMILALKFCSKVNCYGFTFYEPGAKKNYHQEVKIDDEKSNHNLESEKKWFSLFEKNNLLTFERG
jgi:hypothetical protein